MKRPSLRDEAGQLADRAFRAAILYATRNSAFITLGAGIGAAVRYTTAFKQRGEVSSRDP